MNTRPEHGINFRVIAYPPDLDDALIQEAFAAYKEGGDGLYDWWHFRHCVKAGHVLVCEVSTLQGDPFCLFGVELMKDDAGPYVSFLYCVGSVKIEVAAHIVEFIRICLEQYKKIERYRGVGRLRLIGRRGWDRFVKRLNLNIDSGGFISDDQKGVLENGFIRRIK